MQLCYIHLQVLSSLDCKAILYIIESSRVYIHSEEGFIISLNSVSLNQREPCLLTLQNINLQIKVLFYSLSKTYGPEHLF